MSVRGGSRSGFGMDVDGDTQDGVDDGEGEGEGTKPVLPLWGDRRPSAPLQSVTPAGFPVTRRFEHAPSMDQDGVPGGGGHFVITGREGQLERCEDEVRWDAERSTDVRHADAVYCRDLSLSLRLKPCKLSACS